MLAYHNQLHDGNRAVYDNELSAAIVHDDFGYPIIHHPHDYHIMGHDEIDFYLMTDPAYMTLEQLNIFKKIGSSVKKATSSVGKKIKRTTKKASARGKRFWKKNKGKIKKGVNIADKVTGAVDTFASMGGAAVCGPYAAACKAGAKGAHVATSVAAAAANKYIKDDKKKMMLQMLLAQQAYEQQMAANMGYMY